MRQPRRMLTFLVLSLLLSLVVPLAATAQEAGDTGAKIGLKAFRGVSNTALGLVTEIPRTMYYDSVEEGPAYGLIDEIL